MADIAQQELRKSILQQSDQLTFKSRFGLFSHPISTAVGDNGPYRHEQRKRDSNNKPSTQPRNIFTSPTKVGKAPEDFLNPLNSLATSKVHDVYVDPARQSLIQQNEIFKKGNNKDSAFIPASGMKLLMSSTYDYKTQGSPSLDPKRKRNQQGNVIIEARNMVTNPMKNVQRTYLKQLQYISDPYDRANKLQQQRIKRQKSKEPQTAFKLNSSPTGKLFSTNKQIYGSDTPSKQVTARSHSINIYNHDSAFKPASPNKHGVYGYFSQFPKYMQNPEKQKTRKEQNPNKKQAFKGMSIALSRPTPSILCNPNSIKTIVRHSMHH